MRKYLLIFILFFAFSTSQAQRNYWQQKAEYFMDIDFDVVSHQFTGKQKLIYYNNSPETLNRVFYHLYFNAFQPGSMMDVRSRTIKDPDRRVGDRIFGLKDNEIGYQKIKSLKQNGKPVKYKVVGTILEVELASPIPAGKKATFEMEFSAQVPKQIRRSGRDNKEGISYSMAQWYPKMCEYDYQGWHANPYIAREFHGIWGNFDVKISIDSSYMVAATGYLQNPESIGHGYKTNGKTVKRPNSPKLTWHFKAPNVHDFVWAADPDYVHDIVKIDDVDIHLFYQDERETTKENWINLQDYLKKAFPYMNKRFGKYPYKKYSIIQGGDGGMEYGMATLIVGNGSLGGLVGVTTHEFMHSWYQFVLATNESLYPWMDEGFTDYATNEIIAHVYGQEAPQAGSYQSYRYIVEQGTEEALTTHADHYNTNRAYGVASYSKGAVFVHQLGYIIGQENLDKTLLKYFEKWKFKHPNPNDFKRVAEQVSGIELDWYLQYWVQTTHTIDYAIKQVEAKSGKTQVVLERVGKMPMPLDVVVTYEDDSQEVFYIPLRIMRANKPAENDKVKRKDLEAWPWTYPIYQFEIPKKKNEIKSIQIDPSERLADIDLENNVFPTKTKSKKVNEDILFKGE